MLALDLLGMSTRGLSIRPSRIRLVLLIVGVNVVFLGSDEDQHLVDTGDGDVVFHDVQPPPLPFKPGIDAAPILFLPVASQVPVEELARASRGDFLPPVNLV